MQPQEGPDEDGGDLGPPLPPEDRLWRHPSEMGRAAMVDPVATAGDPNRARRPTSAWLVGAVAGLTGAVATLAVVVAFGGFDDSVIDRPVVERVASAPAATLPISIGGNTSAEGVQGIAAQIGPAIARLEVVRPAAEGSSAPTTTTTGSAVLFRDDGYLLTSADLVTGAVTVAVILPDGEVRDGDVVGTDLLTDVGVVRIDGEGFPTALLGLVDGLAVGQPTLIVGSAPNPGDDPALTSGIISSLRRTILADSGTPTRHDMIQTDAPLDPTATGGALLDASGTVVGITTDPPDDVAVDGLSYATPIDTALAVADQIIDTGSAHHPWLGIEGSDIEARTADDLQLAGGAVVATVAEGSPAAAAGLAPNDVIISVGAVTVTSMADLVVELRRHHPGEVVLITYVRSGQLGIGVANLGEA